MKKLLSLSFISIGLLLSINQISTVDYCCNSNYAFCKTHFSQRPQGNNQALVFVGDADKTHLFDNDENYINFNLALGYRQNYNNYDLGRYFFTELGPLNVGVKNTNVDVQNLQLGLAANFTGTACLLPQVKDFSIDLDMFIGFDKWVQGLWFRIRLPFVQNRSNLCLNISNNEIGSGTYPDGFAEPTGTDVSVKYRSLSDALCDGSTIGTIPAREAGSICCEQKCTGLSDVHLELGYDLVRREHGNFGIALIGAIGTGKPNSNNCNRYLFNPSIGSQRSNQIGGALRGQYELLNIAAENKHITLYGDLRATYLTSACNRRLFSLCSNKTTAFNYWMLLDKFDENGTYLGIEQAANILNKRVNVNAGMLEFTLMGQMIRNNWDLSFGYNFWYRTKENLCIPNSALGNGSDLYTVKGDSNISGTTTYSKTDSNIAYLGNTISKASLATLKANAFSSSDIDVCIAQHPQTYSNMLFGYLGYNFNDSWLTPYAGLSVQIEMGRGNTALSMWGAFIKGGISF